MKGLSMTSKASIHAAYEASARAELRRQAPEFGRIPVARYQS
jgi:hypothetical protein